MTVASGVPSAVRLLEVLNNAGVPVDLMISDTGWRLDEELDIKSEELRKVHGRLVAGRCILGPTRRFHGRAVGV